jgi:hypothetical protein
MLCQSSGSLPILREKNLGLELALLQPLREFTFGRAEREKRFHDLPCLVTKLPKRRRVALSPE